MNSKAMSLMWGKYQNKFNYARHISYNEVIEVLSSLLSAKS